MNTHETILKYTSDVHALVNHGLTTIQRQVQNLKDEGPTEAKVAVAAFAEMLRGQSTALEARVKALGGTTSEPIKEAVTAVTGLGAGIMNAIRHSEAAKSIRDDETFFSHLGVSYLMLHTTAASLGDTQTADLAAKGYADSARAIMHVTRILPAITIHALAKDEEVKPRDVSAETQAMVKKAWNWDAPAGI